MLDTNVPLSMWSVDTQAKLGGFFQLAGLNPSDIFRMKTVKGHPWIHHTVYLPSGKGIIIDCLVHPRGKLMFDVLFEEEVPPTRGGCIAFEEDTCYHQRVHRYFGQELIDWQVP